jgi:DNA-binding SARP family transcriptional activator
MDLRTRPGQLDFRILGRVVVRWGRSGPELLLGGRRQRLLLAVLLCDAGQTVPVSDLVHELWGPDAPVAGSDPLTAPLNALRRLLGPEVLVPRWDGYSLDIHQCQLDSFCFERRLRGAQAAAEMGRLAEALGHVDRALSLRRGPAFGHLAAEPALVTEAQRLDRLVIDAQQLRAELFVGLGLANGARADVTKLRVPEHSLLRQRPVPATR